MQLRPQLTSGMYIQTARHATDDLTTLPHTSRFLFAKEGMYSRTTGGPVLHAARADLVIRSVYIVLAILEICTTFVTVRCRPM